MARRPVGEVTLISVRWPSITSMPTKSSRALSGTARCGADLLLAGGKVCGSGCAAAHHIGADVVFRRHAVDRARRRAIDEDDALVALLHLGRKRCTTPKWLAERVAKRS